MDIVNATGLTRRVISHIENGKANPTWATLQDIADALEVSMSELAKMAEKLKAEGKGAQPKSAS